MNPDPIPFEYQAFYIVIPSTSVIGNLFIIYATIRSKQTRVDENADTVDSSTVACSEKQFISGVKDGVERLAPSRLGEGNYVVLYSSCLHDQVFYRGFGCKCNTSVKQIHRSLIVTSSTVVFGWFSTMLIVVIANFLHVEIERIYVNLLAGLFVNSSCATNFFVYYAMSKEYRRLFDEYLHIGKVKNFFGAKSNTVVITRIVHQQPQLFSRTKRG
ncbi:unnamed protein product [Angiostrongylus costaricensis]|uniref:G_PROTEIN_RECEP_F1_2 domain-containing protein n=1 Tax=Angiostrongylus costaricensis TaxID=334426 RepID=A0A0R3Q1V4_ANGCS|nr:unnamed protein product [Angiostrongylus costaricensis]